ncbi:MAG: hypothetical protein HYV60_13795 [Planctomycetia bacterium]|nr:hypothetical protein [Planctomycetia bacterium]
MVYIARNPLADQLSVRGKCPTDDLPGLWDAATEVRVQFGVEPAGPVSSSLKSASAR